MGSATRGAALLLLVVGVLLVADAVRRGGASLSLVLIVPVISGGSAEFLAGAGALFASVVVFFASFAGEWEELPAAQRPPPGRTSTGGVLLIGPLPIFFGSARPASRRAMIAWAAIGLAMTVVLALFFAAVFYRL